MEDANKKCGNIRRDSYSTESACRRGVNAPACLVAEQWTVYKPDAASQHNRLSPSTGHLNFVSVCHKEDEAVYCEGFVMLYRAASSVDSITDYNEFSPSRSRYLRLLSYLTIISLIFILVFCRLSVHWRKC